MGDCAHTIRDDVEATRDIWRCCQCGAIGKGGEVMFTAVESGPEPTRQDLFDQIADLERRLGIRND